MAGKIYREEPGSEIILGPFDSDNYYDIENSSDIIISKRSSLKSVECVVLRQDKLLFIEAKKTAPKDLTATKFIDRLSNMIKPSEQDSYKQLIHSLTIMPTYISDICEKFILSLCLVMSIAEGRVLASSEEMPSSMREAIRNPAIILVFVLIITWSKKDWASNVMDALNMALQKFNKTNRVRILVLTAEQAMQKGLVKEYIPMPEDTKKDM